MPLAADLLALLQSRSGNPQFVHLDKQIEALCDLLDQKFRHTVQHCPTRHAEGSESGPTARPRGKGKRAP